MPVSPIRRPCASYSAVKSPNLTRAADDLVTRRAPMAAVPSSWDTESRTFETVISTGADVQRRDRFGPYTERLDLSAINPESLVGLAVLDEHQRGSSRHRVGTIISARSDDSGLVATIQLSSADDVAPIRQRVADGTLTHVSIGYSVSKWAESKETGGRIRTAKNWKIHETSIVGIPADNGAKIRSQNMPQEFIETEEPSTTENRAAIRQIARSAGLTTEWADGQIDADATVIEARAAAFEAMQERGRNTPRVRVVASNDDPAAAMTRRADALYSRISGTAPTDEARPYMHESLRDIARACVEANGISARAMSPDELFRAAMHTTSDFPQLLTGTGNRTLEAAYQVAQSPLKSVLARQTTLPDFRASSKLKLSDIGTLEKISESGEIKHTTRGESSESYALDTYAAQFSLSRKALINDDLGAFRDWGATAGRMAAETEANLLHKLLTSNPKMGEDGKVLFHADHGNLADAGVSVAMGLSDARKALRTMKGLDGKTPISVTPRYLLVGPEGETAAEKAIAEITAATIENVNPFAGKLTLLVEPRITGNEWYLFADPASLPVLEYAYLSSAHGPQMASREGWDVLGMEFRVVLDFGCGAIDWRGAYKNTGE